MSKEKQAAQEILKHIGGQENILNKKCRMYLSPG